MLKKSWHELWTSIVPIGCCAFCAHMPRYIWLFGRSVKYSSGAWTRHNAVCACVISSAYIQWSLTLKKAAPDSHGRVAANRPFMYRNIVGALTGLPQAPAVNQLEMMPFIRQFLIRVQSMLIDVETACHEPRIGIASSACRVLVVHVPSEIKISPFYCQVWHGPKPSVD